MSHPIMETIPNHVMMMTGFRPDRNGVPANSIFDGTAVRDMDRPATSPTRRSSSKLNATGRRTGTVLSKDYLYGIFGPGPPIAGTEPMLPITDH